MSDPWLTCQNLPVISLYFASWHTQRGISQRLKLRSLVWYHGSSLVEEIRSFKLLWSWQRRSRQRVRLRSVEPRDWSRMREIILLKRIWCIRRAGMRMLSWRTQVFSIFFWYVWGRIEEFFFVNPRMWKRTSARCRNDGRRNLNRFEFLRNFDRT